MVVFRLSQDEYHLLMEACERAGARNLSEFARAGIFEYLQVDVWRGHLNERFASLEEQIATLQCQINHLLQGVSHVDPVPQH